MSKQWKPAKPTVKLQAEPRPSRIRRDPVPASKPATDKQLRWQSNEREILLAVVGMVLFALAIDIIMLAISAYTNS